MPGDGRHRDCTCHRSQRGSVLLLALVFMLLLAMIATTVMRTGVLQLHMAGNDQFLEEAYHQANAIATELSLDPENFYPGGDAGDANCAREAQDPDCDYHLLPVPLHAATPAGVSLDYRITRQPPLLWRGFPVRESEETASSSVRFDAAIFEISVHIDGAGKRLGSAQVAQGIALRVQAGH